MQLFLLLLELIELDLHELACAGLPLLCVHEIPRHHVCSVRLDRLLENRLSVGE